MVVPAALVQQDVPRARLGLYHVARDQAGIPERVRPVPFTLLAGQLKNFPNLGGFQHLMGAASERFPLQKALGSPTSIYLPSRVEGLEELHAAVITALVLIRQHERYIEAIAKIHGQGSRHAVEEAFVQQETVLPPRREVHRYERR